MAKEAHFNEHASLWNSRELNEWVKHALIFDVKYALEQMHDVRNLSGLNAWTKLELILNAKHVFVDFWSVCIYIERERINAWIVKFKWFKCI